jgi:hypothetical protein
MTFGRFYENRNAASWKSKLHGADDFKEFTWYPKGLRKRFNRFRAPWTYMTKAEKNLPVFQRPKGWFPKKDYQTVKKVPTPWDATVWAGLVRTKLGPFLKKCYPTTTSLQIFLDG